MWWSCWCRPLCRAPHRSGSCWIFCLSPEPLHSKLSADFCLETPTWTDRSELQSFLWKHRKAFVILVFKIPHYQYIVKELVYFLTSNIYLFNFTNRSSILSPYMLLLSNRNIFIIFYRKKKSELSTSISYLLKQTNYEFTTVDINLHNGICWKTESIPVGWDSPRRG